MINSLVVDTETTIYQKGNPFARRNKLCYVGTYRPGSIVLASDPTQFPDIQREIDGATLLVGANFKFDLHWLRRGGFKIEKQRVWDVLFAHFLLQAQRTPLPSLQQVCDHYGISGLGDLSEEYWKKGIDTPSIPVSVVLDYLSDDLECTYKCFLRQQEEIDSNPKLRNLFKLHMDDQIVLADMEWNGLKYNMEKSEKQRQEIEQRLATIEQQLSSRCPNTPINWDSGDNVSAYLYGGTIVMDRKEPAGFFKTGNKIGEVRYKWVQDVYPLLRLVEPLEGSELKKADKEKHTGPWSVAEDVLKQLKQVSEVKLLQERAKLTKLLDYLVGFPKLMTEKDWEPGWIHGQFNQSIARTGRLSSSSPNLQNLPDPVLALVETRYNV